jgi:protein-serine/threonine kinase
LERLGFGRLDAEEIKSHEWFKGINWDDVKEKKIDPPFMPRLTGDYDLKYFDRVSLLFKQYNLIYLVFFGCFI